jgi:hypothetical protein
VRIGIVCEGQRGCPEVQVFPHFVKLICPTLDFDPRRDMVPSGNRPRVISEGPRIAKRLLADGCRRVFIIWDVYPPSWDVRQEADCVPQLADLRRNLQAAGLANASIVPVAIHEELEAWLLCDADALNAVIQPQGKRQIQHERYPNVIKNPKVTLQNLFKRGRGRTYNESYSAGQIARQIASTNRLRRSQSFERFEDKLRAVCIKSAGPPRR